MENNARPDARHIIALSICIRCQRKKTPVDIAEMQRRTGWPRPVCCRFAAENIGSIRDAEEEAELKAKKEQKAILDAAGYQRRRAARKLAAEQARAEAASHT